METQHFFLWGLNKRQVLFSWCYNLRANSNPVKCNIFSPVTYQNKLNISKFLIVSVVYGI